MKDKVLDLFKRALSDYEKQTGLTVKPHCFKSGLCYYFNSDAYYRTGRFAYSALFVIIHKYNPYGTPGLNHFFPKGFLSPRIELLKQIITDIEAGKHDDILLKQEVQP